MKKITRISPKPLAKILGAIYAFIGIIGGVLVGVISLVASATGEAQGLFGLAAIILLPLFYGVLGFVSGYVMALLYNLAAKKFGGIELDIE